MNAAFALGFALVGPFLVAVASPQALIVIVAVLYFVAAGFCWTLRRRLPWAATGPPRGRPVADAERAVETMFGQADEGLAYIRDHRFGGVVAVLPWDHGALIGILGVLGPKFATTTLDLGTKDFVVVVLLSGSGSWPESSALNAYGHRLPRRRTIEAGMITMGILLAILSFAGPISALPGGQRRGSDSGVQPCRFPCFPWLSSSPSWLALRRHRLDSFANPASGRAA